MQGSATVERRVRSDLVSKLINLGTTQWLWQPITAQGWWTKPLTR